MSGLAEVSWQKHEGSGDMCTDSEDSRQQRCCKAPISETASRDSGSKDVGHKAHEPAMSECATEADDPETYGYVHAKDCYLRRLVRIEGQIRGIERMVQEEKYCIDVLTQISAATGALQSLALALLEDHLAHCVVSAAKTGGVVAETKLSEASEAIARLVRR